MRTMRLATAALVGAASVISLTAPASFATGDDNDHHRRAHIRVHPKVAWSGERVHVRVRCPRAQADDVRTIRAFSEAFRRDHITLHRDGIFRDHDHHDGRNRDERLYVGSGKVEYKHWGHRREADRDDRWGGWTGPKRHHRHHRHHRRHRRHFLITGRCPHDGFFRTHIQVIERRHHRRHHHHHGGGGYGGGYNGGGYNGGGYNGGKRSGGSYPSGGVKAGEGGSVNNGNALETGAGGALAAAAIGGGAWALRRRRTGE
ncbi:hypothetical protein [Streptomyces silvisoli]|uniref:Gram-positive cocci surface proteins LPxTG domain-containing protein n=1 Tax=Streptomyces silvisoli TaxID=3034235 RepID=A0ABT5ZK62_9ACTN|nr:hypothetical protein [Streptomyces silvisoli]MDF3290221.1 hypothetical protein [Streptomyces silvisoli]